jgi:hypothetical protein
LGQEGKISFIKNFMNNKKVHICNVNLADIIDDDIPVSDKFSSLLNKKNKDFISTNFFKVGDIAYDANMAIKIGSYKKNYYKLSFITDPSYYTYFKTNIFSKKENIFEAFKGKGTSHFVERKIKNKIELSCSGGIADLSFSKILGVGFSYDSKKNRDAPANLPKIWVEREPFAFTVVGLGPSRKRIYRTIDFWSTYGSNPEGNFYQKSIILQAAELSHMLDVEDNCTTVTGRSYDFFSQKCQSLILGGASVYHSLIPNKNFFNLYIGGAWNIYIPENETWINELSNFFMHIYYYKNTDI